MVAIFTYAPVQIYLERITHGQFSGSFFAWLPHCFEGIYLGDGSAGNFAIIPMHMWYVFFLLLYCVLFYPLFRWWKGTRPPRLGSHRQRHRFTTRPHGWLCALPDPHPAPLRLRHSPPEAGSGGWPYPYYPFFLIYGFVTASNERLQTNLRRMCWPRPGAGHGLHHNPDDPRRHSPPLAAR
ncbi:MAG: hypothetical protein M0C28_29235 [Candidatus Moduliflexus flocculans]|nr:hypothetical protein [Candidatus Moduliflexus flocculans]